MVVLPPLEQMYDRTEFEAYQQLGAATILDAVGCL
jgi:hypothetical protein